MKTDTDEGVVYWVRFRPVEMAVLRREGIEIPLLAGLGAESMTTADPVHGTETVSIQKNVKVLGDDVFRHPVDAINLSLIERVQNGNLRNHIVQRMILRVHAEGARDNPVGSEISFSLIEGFCTGLQELTKVWWKSSGAQARRQVIPIFAGDEVERERNTI